METWTTSLRSLLPKGLPWAWIERALFLAGILFLGIYAWAYIDARLYEREQERLLEQAIAAGPPPAVQGTHAAAEIGKNPELPRCTEGSYGPAADDTCRSNRRRSRSVRRPRRLRNKRS